MCAHGATICRLPALLALTGVVSTPAWSAYGEHGGFNSNGNATTGSGLVCMTCHGAHWSLDGVTRQLYTHLLQSNPGGDPNGACLACHGSGQVAELPLTWTETQYQWGSLPAGKDKTFFDDFNFAEFLASPHGSNDLDGSGPYAAGACGPCHEAHDQPYPSQLKGNYWYYIGMDASGVPTGQPRTTAGPNTAATDLSQDLCLGCHDGDGPATTDIEWEYNHQGDRQGHSPTSSPLANLGDWPAGTQMPCTLCHSVHGHNSTTKFLIRTDGWLGNISRPSLVDGLDDRGNPNPDEPLVTDPWPAALEVWMTSTLTTFNSGVHPLYSHNLCRVCHQAEGGGTRDHVRWVEDIEMISKHTDGQPPCFNCHYSFHYPHKTTSIPDRTAGQSLMVTHAPQELSSGSLGAEEWTAIATSEEGPLRAFAWRASLPAVAGDNVDFKVVVAEPGQAWLTAEPGRRSVTLSPSPDDDSLVGQFSVPADLAEKKVKFAAYLEDQWANIHRLSTEQTLTVTAKTGLTLTASPVDLAADASSTAGVVARLVDARGNPVRGEFIRFMKVQGPGRLRPRRPVTNRDGIATAELVSGLTAESILLEAAAEGEGLTATCAVTQTVSQVVEVILESTGATDSTLSAQGLGPGHTLSVTVQVTPPRLPADGFSTAEVIAAVHNSRGVPVRGAKVQLEVTPSVGLIEPREVTTDASGLARATYTAGGAPGVYEVVATVPRTDSRGSAEITLTTGGAADITVTVSPSRLPADGVSVARIEAEVVDLFGGPVADVEVAAAPLFSQQGRVVMDADRTGLDGRVTGRYTAGIAPGAVSLRFFVRSPLPAELQSDETSLAKSLDRGTVRKRATARLRDVSGGTDGAEGLLAPLRRPGNSPLGNGWPRWEGRRGAP